MVHPCSQLYNHDIVNLFLVVLVLIFFKHIQILILFYLLTLKNQPLLLYLLVKTTASFRAFYSLQHHLKFSLDLPDHLRDTLQEVHLWYPQIYHPKIHPMHLHGSTGTAMSP